eukprot:scaffold4948_cov64-Phaeocystis_antarctica.AAC.2
MMRNTVSSFAKESISPLIWSPMRAMARLNELPRHAAVSTSWGTNSDQAGVEPLAGRLARFHTSSAPWLVAWLSVSVKCSRK